MSERLRRIDAESRRLAQIEYKNPSSRYLTAIAGCVRLFRGFCKHSSPCKIKLTVFFFYISFKSILQHAWEAFHLVVELAGVPRLLNF